LPWLTATGLDTSPQFLGHGVAPNAAKKVFELGIFLHLSFYAINELRTEAGKKILERTSRQDFFDRIRVRRVQRLKYQLPA
jgi:hypothetical protein